jgi:hypothetical protein
MARGKKSKPVTKKFWSFLRFMPSAIRARVIRAKFDIRYDLSADYVLKQAESQDEIQSALNIVHDAYTRLGYIDEHPERVHFNAFICLPTTTILIVKFKDEVVGTMSIVADSGIGLPSEITWDLQQIRSETMKIGEVSALAIKRSHKTSRGHLLLMLCKLMYEFGTQILDLDGVVIAATVEAEPFYTDLLLFKKVVAKTGQRHMAVKGNSSTCCFVNFKKVRADYLSIYGNKRRDKNLYHFFTEFVSPNFKLPEKTLSLHGLLHAKNQAVLKLLAESESLKLGLTFKQKLALANTDPSHRIEHAIDLKETGELRMNPRVVIRSVGALIYHGPTDLVIQGAFIDVSASGFQIKTVAPNAAVKVGDLHIVVVRLASEAFSVSATVRWFSGPVFGFEVDEESRSGWKKFAALAFAEIGLPLSHQRSRLNEQSQFGN